jgi:hypothetical protein
VKTTLTIVSRLAGSFWWPTGVEWVKPINVTFTLTRGPIHGLDEVDSLREAVDRICSDDDSQVSPVLSPDGYVELTRFSASGRRWVGRRFPLRWFGSIADYLAAEPIIDRSEDDWYLLDCAWIASRVDEEFERTDPLRAAVDPVGARHDIAERVFAEWRAEQ